MHARTSYYYDKTCAMKLDAADMEEMFPSSAASGRGYIMLTE